MEQNQSKALIAIVIIAIIGIAGGFLWYITRPATDDFEFAPSGQNIDTERTIVAQSTNIIVYAPRMNERVGTPIVIEGEARVFENSVSYRLLDSKGGIIAEGFTTANSPDIGQFGPFRAELVYQAENDGAGTIEVFWYSAKDGTPADVVTIPVTYTRTPEFIKG